MDIFIGKNIKEHYGDLVLLVLEEDTVVIRSLENDYIETVEWTAELEEMFERRTQFHARVEEDHIRVIRYAPLHGHSGYSLLDGASQIHDMVAKAEHHMAITDHGNMFGTLEFYKQMTKAGKNPIIGSELYSEDVHGEKKRYHLVVLAETLEGYKNLSKLSSFSYDNVYYKPQVSYDLLREYSEGLIVTSACMSGELSRAILRDDMDEARLVIETMIDIFGKENYFIEIQRHGIDEEDILNPALIAFAKEYGLKLVATADSHYTNEEDRESQEILMCIGTKSTMDNPDRMKFDGGGYHIHTSEEMVELFKDIPEALDNTLDIAERIQVDLDLETVYMPHYDVPAPFTSEKDYFIHLCEEGFKARFEGTDMMNDPEYQERLQFEIDTINNMGFPGYFIITWDIIKFAKDNGILVGPGRGSACGSLVAYVLNITDIDPIPYGLLFERFLNPDRISMPDIDTDFPDDRRDEVAEYVKEKYGEKSVARIVTFTRLTAKAAVKDVARVLGYPASFANKVSKTIPATPGMTFDKAFQESVEFKQLYESEEDVREIVDHAMKLEKNPRNTGVHACGFIISPSAVTDYMPQFRQKDRDTGEMVVTTQYDKDECEEMGLLKMDLLGLRTMGVIAHALEDINQRRANNNEHALTLENIPMFDLTSFQHISEGKTAGVFQLESSGMTGFMKQLFQDVNNFQGETESVELFERLVAGISLYRPGPMDEIPNYIANMINSEEIEYDADALEPILKNTYGTIVYQEQVMQIVRDLGGFSRGQSDTIRKAMGKKIDSIMDEYGKYFIYGSKEENIEGCLAKGITQKEGDLIWEKMVKFSKYAFNKSHAVGYSYLSSKTAYLAKHYPAEYMTATLNSFINKANRIKKYMAEAKKQQIPVLPPDINRSKENFSVDGNSIRFGLKGIRSVGGTSGRIINERSVNGEFDTFKGFVTRMLRHSRITRLVIESLVYAGALDDFEGTRKEKLLIMDEMLEFAKMIRASEDAKLYNIFELVELKDDVMADVRIQAAGEMDKALLLEREREYAGFYITEHPIEDYVEDLEHANRIRLSDLVDEIESIKESKGIIEYESRNTFKMAGVITEVNTYYTKKTGDPLNVFTIEDETGDMRCVAFSDVIERNSALFTEGQLVYLEGTVRSDESETQVTVRTIADIHDLKRYVRPTTYVLKGSEVVETARSQYAEINDLKTVFGLHPQEGEGVILKFEQDGKQFTMPFNVTGSINVQIALQEIMGQENVYAIYE